MVLDRHRLAGPWNQDQASMTATNGNNVKTGILALDDVLGGGLIANRVYLVQGAPGCGKNTLALQYLLEGVRSGETVLYVTLSESKTELQANAASHGWSLDHVNIWELIP